MKLLINIESFNILWFLKLFIIYIFSYFNFEFLYDKLKVIML